MPPPRLEINRPRIRYLIAAALVSPLLYFLSTSNTVREHTNALSYSIQSSFSTPKYTDDELVDTILPNKDYLAPEEAKRWCSNYRYDVFPLRDKPRKIYDLVLVNKELDWLEIRLGQMYDHVDYFIIVEAATTFTGLPKPLTIKDNWHRFSPYYDKMIRHTLQDSPEPFDSAWQREAFSRNAMYNQVIPFLTGAQEADIGDVIIVSDVDEIPKPETLKTLRNCDFPQQVTLQSSMYYYSFQWALRQVDWPHPQATVYAGESTIEPDELRVTKPEATIHHAAWHCSYCFSTLAETIDKVISFSHAELNLPQFRDPEQILQRVRGGRDFFDREDLLYDRVENNQDVPSFLKENRDRFAFALDRDPESANFADFNKSFGTIGT